MRAVLARGFGGVEVLQVAEMAVPAAGPGQVRIGSRPRLSIRLIWRPGPGR